MKEQLHRKLISEILRTFQGALQHLHVHIQRCGKSEHNYLVEPDTTSGAVE